MPAHGARGLRDLVRHGRGARGAAGAPPPSSRDALAAQVHAPSAHWTPRESSADLSRAEEVPAPAQLGKRLFEGLFQRQLPPERARLVNNVMHWSYGMFQAGQYGIVAGSLRRPRSRYGLLFGAAL